MNARVLLAVLTLSVAAPSLAAAQDGPISVQGSVGSHVNVSGDTQSLSVAFWPSEYISLVVSGERLHMPTDVTYYQQGFGATRGGTTHFMSLEVRFSPITLGRVTPYALVGAGRGQVNLNVNEIFPNPVKHDAALAFFGGGARVRLTDHLSAFADMRPMLQVERSADGLYLFLPLRAGVAWRF